MKNLLVISPHFSTGGAPQVTVNKVQLLLNEFNIKVIEHDFLAWNYVVQRNRMIDLVGTNNFHTLGDNKLEDLQKIVEEFQPSVIAMEEFPEMFLRSECADYLYANDRAWTIIETTHDSSFNPLSKRFMPDKFVFVSAYSAFKYNHLEIPTEIIEYPIDQKSRDKSAKRLKLGLDPNFKHVVIVGLFTPRKNQKYAFELCDKLHKYPIKFHFLGNQAGNFEHYWKPLMDWKQNSNTLDNCVVWGERDDVTDFIEASDMFLFCSKGERTNKELNPIAIKEAMEYDIHKLMYNLDVYCNKYSNYQNVHYLDGNIDSDAEKMVNILDVKMSDNEKELIVIGTYPNLKERVRLTKECIQRLKPLNRKIMVVSHYPIDEETQRLCDYYIYDQHNPLCHHSYYTRFYNHTHFYDAEVNINGLKNTNQSLTVLTNLFNAFKSAQKFGYEKIFYTTFDVLVHDDDLQEISYSFSTINENNRAFLCSLNTPFGKGIQTTAMTFDVNFWFNVFHDVRSAEEYNKVCESIGSQNFLEDYMIKCLNRVDSSLYTLLHNNEETFLKKSGLGVSSNSEYYSILPIQDRSNEFMFYFFSYNLDERKINITIKEEGNEIFNTRFQVNKMREYKKDFKYEGKSISLQLDFYDGEDLYKTETYDINEITIQKFRNTGSFKWKNQKPKIKLVHFQVTKDDERQEKSRESLQKVKEYGWEYILHTNLPYADLPPKYNCIRPDCVSLELYDEQRVQRYGTALTPAHYGCYESFKNAILSEFTNDIDFLIVCEGDCIIEVPTHEFISKVEQCSQIMNDNHVGYMSFGDIETLEHGWLQSKVVEEIPNQDLMFITNHIIGIQCIMFPKKISQYLKHQFRTHNWDAADIFLNTIMSKSGMKFGIVKDRLTTQADGYSLIDQQFKTFRKK
jgi:glycosyltransferase involved in cell wall biosynthesis